MKFLNWFICWMFGHEPNDDAPVINFGFFDEEEFEVTKITLCKRCSKIITYDPQLGGWIGW